jgi:hypothetical protein
MRWLGLALALVAGFVLAWDVFGLPAAEPGQEVAGEASRDRHLGRILSGIGITIGMLLIVIAARKFDHGEAGSL